MKATTRILALLLVAVLMIGMFAGCDQTTPTTTVGGDDTTTVGGDDTTTAGGNDTTTVVGNANVDKTNKHELTVMVMNSIGGDYDMNNVYDLEIWKKVEELMGAYGVTLKLQIVESDQYETAIQTTLAGGLDSMPDLIFAENKKLSDTLRMQAADQGILASIQDILEYSDGTAVEFYNNYPVYLARSAYNGKNYWFGEFQEVYYGGELLDLGMASPSNINIREDWLNALGYTEIPNTLEEIEEFILKCQAEDVNQTGVVDEVFSMAISGFGSAAYLNTWFGIPVTEFQPNYQTGEIDLGWETGDLKGFFELMQKWIDMGIVPIDAVGTTSQSKWYKQNKAACYGTYFCNSWSIVPATCPVPEGAAEPNIIGIIPDRELYPDAYMYHDAGPSMDNRLMVVAADADLEAVAHVLDVLCSDEWNFMLENGVEGWSFEYDENGEIVLINGAENGHTALADPESAVTGRPVISFGIFPDVVTFFNLEDDEAACNTIVELSQFRAALNAEEWPAIYGGQSTSMLATATDEEQAVIDEYLSEFEAKSDELWLSLILGEISLDDWDTEVIDVLNSYGMQELKAVYQARYDRYYEAYQDYLAAK